MRSFRMLSFMGVGGGGAKTKDMDIPVAHSPSSAGRHEMSTTRHPSSSVHERCFVSRANAWATSSICDWIWSNGVLPRATTWRRARGVRRGDRASAKRQSISVDWSLLLFLIRQIFYSARLRVPSPTAPLPSLWAHSRAAGGGGGDMVVFWSIDSASSNDAAMTTLAYSNPPRKSLLVADSTQ